MTDIERFFHICGRIIVIKAWASVVGQDHGTVNKCKRLMSDDDEDTIILLKVLFIRSQDEGNLQLDQMLLDNSNIESGGHVGTKRKVNSQFNLTRSNLIEATTITTWRRLYNWIELIIMKHKRIMIASIGIRSSINRSLMFIVSENVFNMYYDDVTDTSSSVIAEKVPGCFIFLSHNLKLVVDYLYLPFQY